MAGDEEIEELKEAIRTINMKLQELQSKLDNVETTVIGNVQSVVAVVQSDNQHANQLVELGDQLAALQTLATSSPPRRCAAS